VNVHYFSGDTITGLGDVYCHRFSCPGCYTLIGPRWEIILLNGSQIVWTSPPSL